MLRNWKKTASQQDYHKDVGLVWHSWKRWEKSCEGYHLKLNSKETGKKNPTMSATTEEMKRWNCRPKSSRTSKRLKQTEKSNGLCFDRRKGDPKAIKRTHWKRQKNNDICFERSSRTNRLKLTKKKNNHICVELNTKRNVESNLKFNYVEDDEPAKRSRTSRLDYTAIFMFSSFDRQTHWHWQSHSFKQHR